MNRCQICGKLLDQLDDAGSIDCGGDCMECMAKIGQDPDCIESLKQAGWIQECGDPECEFCDLKRPG